MLPPVNDPIHSPSFMRNLTIHKNYINKDGEPDEFHFDVRSDQLPMLKSFIGKELLNNSYHLNIYYNI